VEVVEAGLLAGPPDVVRGAGGQLVSKKNNARTGRNFRFIGRR
jgi:hypothetical protein